MGGKGERGSIGKLERKRKAKKYVKGSIRCAAAAVSGRSSVFSTLSRNEILSNRKRLKAQRKFESLVFFVKFLKIEMKLFSYD